MLARTIIAVGTTMNGHVDSSPLQRGSMMEGMRCQKSARSKDMRKSQYLSNRHRLITCIYYISLMPPATLPSAAQMGRACGSEGIVNLDLHKLT